MHAGRRAGWAAALLAGASLGIAGLQAPMAAAAPMVAHKQHSHHYNVGRPHSPELLRKLAGPARSAGSRSAALHQQVIAGAVQGVDVASQQHPGGAAIDWAAVASDGIGFAAVKATEGDYYTNPYAPADLTGAKDAGLSTLAYAFGIPNGNGSSSSPTVQADDMVNYLTSNGISPLPPLVLDIEYNPYGAECYGLTQSAMVTWINGFSAEVLAKTGRLPIIYSTQDWLATCAGDSTALGNSPLWIAQYSTSSSPSPLPANWTDWGIWQYSSTGTVNGIPGSSSNTDLDQFNPDSYIALAKLLVFNPGTQSTAPGSAISGQIEAYPEQAGTVMSYNPKTIMPSWLNLDPATGQFTGTAPSSPGSYQVTVTVSDVTPGPFAPPVIGPLQPAIAVSGAFGSVSFTWSIGGTWANATEVPGTATLNTSATEAPLGVLRAGW